MYRPILVTDNFMTIMLLIYFIIQECETEKVSYYLNVERPYIDYYDPAYYANVSAISRRYNRTDAHHYLTLEFDMLKFDKHCVHSFTFYEFLSTLNKRYIVELLYDFCDWIENDIFLSTAFRNAFYKIPLAERPMAEFKCPMKPGRYIFKNLIIPIIKMPVAFPYQDGRIYYMQACKNKTIAKTHSDFHIIKHVRSVEKKIRS